jgi:hypothetical protein
MKPRITINETSGGSLEIWFNELGRDLLVNKLQALNEKNSELHLSHSMGGKVELEYRPYRDTDRVFLYAKVLFRTEKWDRIHYPHVLDPD